MADVLKGRVTDAYDDDLVVFLIGMRVNRFLAVRQWLPVARAMTPMLAELAADAESGFLGHQMSLAGRGPLLVQYWRSADHLIAYAASAQGAHRPAWQAFNARARAGAGAVGIWHETYAVAGGAHETIYHDMPATGLARVTGHVPVGHRGDGARERLQQ